MAPGWLVKKATAKARRSAWTVARTPTRSATRMTVSQMIVFERSARRTLAGRRFGIT
jgi:hypothetical protein